MEVIVSLDPSIDFSVLPLELVWFVIKELTMSEFSAFYRSCKANYHIIHDTNFFWSLSKRCLVFALEFPSCEIRPPYVQKRLRYRRELLGLESDSTALTSIAEEENESLLGRNKPSLSCDKEEYVAFYSKYADVFQPTRIANRRKRDLARRIYNTRIVRDFWYLLGMNPFWNFLFLVSFLAFSILVGLYQLGVRGVSHSHLTLYLIT